MSDSSEDENLSKFKEAVDTSFTKLINDAKTEPSNGKLLLGKLYKFFTALF